MRLIDADALIEDLKGSLFYSDAIPFVEDAPTAYDVEKVVAELDNKKYWEYDDEGFSIGMVVSLGNAIMIVRKGGVE